MCLFPYPNKNENGIAFKRGITKFDCGGCPECLSHKSRLWALRCAMEAKVSVGMMITLTYDSYVYDSNGKIIGERLRDDLKLDKTHVQRFMKRLRRKYSDKKIKYLATAERGKRTNRPHYHLLIFGVLFDDLIFYKKSKRGNIIYTSKTLNKIWRSDKQHDGGICTVDCINISAKVAAYCTKYCAKDCGEDETFMLFSQGIGDEKLVQEFDGKSYWIDGREYPIPKLIWRRMTESWFGLDGYSKYISPADKGYLPKMTEYGYVMQRELRSVIIKRAYRAQIKREILSAYRDNWSPYKRYIRYWSRKAELYEKYKPKDIDRILALPEDKYRSYRAKAVKAYQCKLLGLPFQPPRSKCKYWLFPSKNVDKFDYHVRSDENFDLDLLNKLEENTCLDLTAQLIFNMIRGSLCNKTEKENDLVEPALSDENYEYFERFRMRGRTSLAVKPRHDTASDTDGRFKYATIKKRYRTPAAFYLDEDLLRFKKGVQQLTFFPVLKKTREKCPF